MLAMLAQRQHGSRLGQLKSSMHSCCFALLGLIGSKLISVLVSTLSGLRKEYRELPVSLQRTLVPYPTLTQNQSSQSSQTKEQHANADETMAGSSAAGSDTASDYPPPVPRMR